jgi:hypothetical protein
MDPKEEEAAAAATAQAAADKAAADAAAAAAAAEAAKNKAPEAYDLKLSEGSHLDATAVEKTATIARELGLSQEAAAKVFGHLESMVGERVTATTQDFAPGGPVWTKQVEQWEAEALADPILGVTPEKLQANVKVVKGYIEKFFEPEILEFLDTTGLGSNPRFLRGLLKATKAFAEGSTLDRGSETKPALTDEDARAKKFYGTPTPSK